MSTHHPLRVFAGLANRPLAEKVTNILDGLIREAAQQTRPDGRLLVEPLDEPLGLGKSVTTVMPDSEVHVMIEQVVRDQDVFIIQPCSKPVNDHLMELLLYIDAFRRASAHEVTAVIPYFPYARQERMARGREAISAKVVARMLQTLGVSRVIYFDIHSPATQGFFDIPVDPLTALTVLADEFRKPDFANAVVVSPDVGRAKFAGRYAEALKLPLAIMHKRRNPNETTEVTHLVGDVKDKIPIIIDDVIAGGSVLTQIDALFAAGARPEAQFAITHGVFSPKALDILKGDDRIKRIVITDTICQPETIKKNPKIKIVSVADLLAQVIWRIHTGASISPLIDKI